MLIIVFVFTFENIMQWRIKNPLLSSFTTHQKRCVSFESSCFTFSFSFCCIALCTRIKSCNFRNCLHAMHACCLAFWTKSILVQTISSCQAYDDAQKSFSCDFTGCKCVLTDTCWNLLCVCMYQFNVGFKQGKNDSNKRWKIKKTSYV